MVKNTESQKSEEDTINSIDAIINELGSLVNTDDTISVDMQKYYDAQEQLAQDLKQEKIDQRNAKKVFQLQVREKNAQHIYYLLTNKLGFKASLREYSAMFDAVYNLRFGIDESIVRTTNDLYQEIFDTPANLSQKRRRSINFSQLPVQSIWLNGNPIGDIKGRKDSNTGKKLNKRMNYFNTPAVLDDQELIDILTVMKENSQLLSINFKSKTFVLWCNSSLTPALRARDKFYKTNQLSALVKMDTRHKRVFDWWKAQLKALES